VFVIPDFKTSKSLFEVDVVYYRCHRADIRCHRNRSSKKRKSECQLWGVNDARHGKEKLPSIRC
jgi:hypothetical protein